METAKISDVKMATATEHHQISKYMTETDKRPFFLCGDAASILRTFPKECVACAMTSPPYWGHRKYANGGIGEEADYNEFVQRLLEVFMEVKRVLKPTGSFWLNIGDTYQNKGLVGIPWRVALAMTDKQGWVLRNEVIWHKVKGGPDNAPDKLRNVHEPLFHFVKQAKDYFYDVGPIRRNPNHSKVVNGRVVSATGVSGVRYRQQIERSSALTDAEKKEAHAALETMLKEMSEDRIADFRMIIRGQQRTTHSDSASVSGRAREIELKGFYFLKYHPDGSKPPDVWDIIPEDTQNRVGHFAPYPEELCRIPILSTCPKDGVVLDPFCGTGTTMLAAFHLGRKSVGIDISPDYIEDAEERCYRKLI